MTKHTDLQSQLADVRSQVSQAPRKPLPLSAELISGDWGADSWVRISTPENGRAHFSSLSHLFTVVRDAVRLASNDPTWSIRYASQVKNDNLPFLHCASRRVIMFDPMMVFRDPIREFYNLKQFTWCILPSQAHYLKSLGDVQAVNERQSTLEALRAAMPDVAE